MHWAGSTSRVLIDPCVTHPSAQVSGGDIHVMTRSGEVRTSRSEASWASNRYWRLVSARAFAACTYLVVSRQIAEAPTTTPSASRTGERVIEAGNTVPSLRTRLV